MDPNMLGRVPHVLVDDIAGLDLPPDAVHHLRRVLRLRPGSAVTATDGAGGWRACTLQPDGLEAAGPVAVVARLAPPLTVAFALTKGTKPELVVQKLTELGVDRIVPFRAEHSVVRWSPDKAAHHHDRWRLVARGAVGQSRGCWLPQVDPVCHLGDVVDLGAVPVHRGGRALTTGDHAIAVGPEGGWTDDELDRLAPPVGLGPNVLRAETAAIAAGALLTAIRSGVVTAANDAVADDPGPPSSAHHG